MMMNEEYRSIIDSHINGQGRQMVSQIEEFGWVDFAYELQEDETLTDAERVKILLKEHSDSVLNRAQELCLLLNIKAKQVKKEDECAMANAPRDCVQACMMANGGSFAASLARSFQAADSTNYKRLRAAFPDIWNRYAQMWIDAQPKVEA